jgi:hypothetical protein
MTSILKHSGFYALIFFFLFILISLRRNLCYIAESNTGKEIILLFSTEHNRQGCFLLVLLS